jgi:hypothetical protein
MDCVLTGSLVPIQVSSYLDVVVDLDLSESEGPVLL